MQLQFDPDVQAVAEFMQRNIEAARLVSVAAAVAALAPILWGRYAAEPVVPLALGEHQPSITSNGQIAKAA